MGFVPYLAMTAGDFARNGSVPEHPVWLTACKSSLWTDLPPFLPRGTMLALTDELPLEGQDPEALREAIGKAIFRLGSQGILLDFQHPGSPAAASLAEALTTSLPCPVAVSEGYARGLDCPVFLSPVPPDVLLTDHLAPWKGREIWLELSAEGLEILLTEAGATGKTLPRLLPGTGGFADKRLHSHYAVTVENHAARFILWRTKGDLEGLMEEAEALGVSRVIGLYQELHPFLQSR